ncbi:MAG: ThiF family adenylyltransferase, partial [Planctomycetota bacterium]
ATVRPLPLLPTSPSMHESQDATTRYRRQMRFAPLGEKGQRRLLDSRALVCGCGALGSVAAELLVRAGVGFVRIVDRDFLEADNLHRQMLLTEQDVEQTLPKAVAAARRLAAVNSSVRVDPVVADVAATNVKSLASDVDVVVDGTDNFETRYLLNDFSVSCGLPWVFGGCVGAEGQAFPILPHETPCLRCLMPDPPPAELQPTCETTGVLGPIVSTIASLQAMEAIKILSGNRSDVNRRMTIVDLWSNELRSVGVSRASVGANCPACVERRFEWLEGKRGAQAAVLCGRNAVQITPVEPSRLSLVELEAKLRGMGEVTSNAFLLRLEVEGCRLTVFADGRTIVSGVDDPGEARAIHARYIGG